MALFIYQHFKDISDAFMEQYESKTNEYKLRHASYNKDRIRINYGSQKTTYTIPDFLNEHPVIFTLIQSSLSVQSFKKKVDVYLLGLQWTSYDIDKRDITVDYRSVFLLCDLVCTCNANS